MGRAARRSAGRDAPAAPHEYRSDIARAGTGDFPFEGSGDGAGVPGAGWPANDAGIGPCRQSPDHRLKPARAWVSRLTHDGQRKKNQANGFSLKTREIMYRHQRCFVVGMQGKRLLAGPAWQR
jgi:hypothetical protein